jgi:predicted RNase H-like HicB family nuclease
MANFTIIYNHEAGVYRGKFLEIPGVISEAETLEELKANMTDSITLAIKSYTYQRYPL